MEEREILQCLSDQRLELKQYESDRFVARAESAQIDLDSHLAQVVTGVRWSGKSTLCHNGIKGKKRRIRIRQF